MFLIYFISYGCNDSALVFLGGAEASASPSFALPMFITIKKIIILHLFLGVPAATVGGTGTPWHTRGYAPDFNYSYRFPTCRLRLLHSKNDHSATATAEKGASVQRIRPASVASPLSGGGAYSVRLDELSFRVPLATVQIKHILTVFLSCSVLFSLTAAAARRRMISDLISEMRLVEKSAFGSRIRPASVMSPLVYFM